MTIATDQLPELVATVSAPFDLPRVPSDAKFADLNVDFLPSSQLSEIGTRLCEARKTLQITEKIRIEYLYKRKGGVSGGRAVFGNCIKTSGLVKYFATDARRSIVDYVIWIAADAVRDTRMALWQLEALLYHELLHISVETNEKTDEEKLTTRAHDWEGFNAEIDAYGLWWSDLKSMGQHVRQLKLSGMDEAVSDMRAFHHDMSQRGINVSLSAGSR